jgi:oligopeptide/dipeptide ABC transporter ATP-binding protein
MTSSNFPVLEVNDVSVEYETHNNESLRAVDEVSFEIYSDDIFGLIGESGCGKSTIAKAILGLLPRNGSVVEGEILLNGTDLTTLSVKKLNQIRWKEISLISQGAMNAFNPVHRISTQIIEAIQNHGNVSDAEARERVAELFDSVGLDADRMDEYPHQFSGGMRQRAYIAMALAHNPSVVIADEPTTALDVIVQDQILKRIKELQDEFDLSILLITHDIGVVAETCNRMGIMYAGKMMEYGNLPSIFSDPHNPYTLGLKNAFPSLSGERQDLISIPGSPPDLSNQPTGCRFATRCPFETEECTASHPPLEEIDDDHFSACYRNEEYKLMQHQADERDTWLQRERSTETGSLIK